MVDLSANGEMFQVTGAYLPCLFGCVVDADYQGLPVFVCAYPHMVVDAPDALDSNVSEDIFVDSVSEFRGQFVEKW